MKNINPYLRDLRGRPVLFKRQIPADLRPEGKAAQRRRKQMDRQRQKLGPFVITDEAAEIPPEMWEQLGTFAVSRDDWKPEATDENIRRCQEQCAWKGGSPCLSEDCPRKIPAPTELQAADSSEVPRADRQDLASDPLAFMQQYGVADPQPYEKAVMQILDEAVPVSPDPKEQPLSDREFWGSNENPPAAGG